MVIGSCYFTEKFIGGNYAKIHHRSFGFALRLAKMPYIRHSNKQGANLQIAMCSGKNIKQRRNIMKIIIIAIFGVLASAAIGFAASFIFEGVEAGTIMELVL